ncbi:MAG TPA: methyltransferase [Kouleothrix sp.]|nr:methyltransferase [Kouleothrix sp.]
MDVRIRPYEQVHTLSVQLGSQALKLVTKPGLPYWDAVRPADALLEAAVQVNAHSRLLVLGCGAGLLGAALAPRASQGHLLLVDTSYIALEMARRTLAANGIVNAQVLDTPSALPTYANACDAVVIVAPPDRKLARRWLLEAWYALAEGGTLWLAGANDHGIRSVMADAAELFGAAPVIAYRQGQRLAQAQRRAGATPTPAWASTPGIAPGTWREFTIELRGQQLQVCGLAGVFAHDRLDDGTRLLLESMPSPHGARVLDLGCGTGIIGALAARLGAAQAELVDANILAVASASATLARNTIGNARAYAADGIPAAHLPSYDLVLSNPPFHVGKTIDYEVAQAFIRQTRQALRPNGQFVLVANQFLRYDRLLVAHFEHVACLAQTSSFRVWRAA